jgi:hypothetical protein
MIPTKTQTKQSHFSKFKHIKIADLSRIDNVRHLFARSNLVSSAYIGNEQHRQEQSPFQNRLFYFEDINSHCVLTYAFTDSAFAQYDLKKSLLKK